jgi:sec-independent protein translocase protein TatB
MFDIGWTEITFILIVAIIVIGPKELPRVLRMVGQWVGKAKSMTSEFRGHVDDMIRDTELDEVKKQIDSAGSFDPNSALEGTIDPDGEIKNAFDFSEDKYSNPEDLDGIPDGDNIDDDTVLEGETQDPETQKLSKEPRKEFPPEKLINQEKDIKD